MKPILTQAALAALTATGALAALPTTAPPRDVPAITSAAIPAPILEARRGRGADDPAGHTRRGRGADDPVGHG